MLPKCQMPNPIACGSQKTTFCSARLSQGSFCSLSKSRPPFCIETERGLQHSILLEPSIGRRDWYRVHGYAFGVPLWPSGNRGSPVAPRGRHLRTLGPAPAPGVEAWACNVRLTDAFLPSPPSSLHRAPSGIACGTVRLPGAPWHSPRRPGPGEPAPAAAGRSSA